MVPLRISPGNRFEIRLQHLASGKASSGQGKTMLKAYQNAQAAFIGAKYYPGITLRFEELFDSCRDRVTNDLGCYRFHMEDGRAQVTIIRLVRQ